MFALCGDPGRPADGARFDRDAGPDNWFEAPDNLGFDPAGRLWVCTEWPGPPRPLVIVITRNDGGPI